MIEIIGTALHQWDTGRSVKVTDIEVDHVHFANKGDSKAVIMDIADSQVKVPDYLFQTGKQLCVYAVRNGITVESRVFFVTKRERPENYIYEEDQRNYIYEIIKDAKDATENAHKTTKELENAWSNLYPMFSERSSVVTCEPIEGYNLEVVSHIATSDIGVNNVSLWHGGKNHFDVRKVIGPTNNNAVVNNGDGTLTVNQNASNAHGGPYKLRNFAPGLRAGYTYTLSAKTTGANKFVYLQGSYNQQVPFGSSLIVTEAMLDDNILWYCNPGNVPAVISDIQIELGTNATEFEPYNGNVYAASFGKTVLSGSYDWSTGTLTDGGGNVTNYTKQDIIALPGLNILSSDTGHTTVTGRSDLSVYIRKQIVPSARISSVVLPASKWVGNGSLHSQVVSIAGITENSQVNLTPSVEQLSIFYEKDITFVTENDGGVVTIYVIGQKPQNDYTIQANIVEVSV